MDGRLPAPACSHREAWLLVVRTHDAATEPAGDQKQRAQLAGRSVKACPETMMSGNMEMAVGR